MTTLVEKRFKKASYDFGVQIASITAKGWFSLEDVDTLMELADSITLNNPDPERSHRKAVGWVKEAQKEEAIKKLLNKGFWIYDGNMSKTVIEPHTEPEKPKWVHGELLHPLAAEYPFPKTE